MSTITKERLRKIQQWRKTYGPGSNVVLPAEEAEELARIALASLTAEPIGAFHISDQQVGGTSDYIKDGEWPIDNGVIEVYAAPPAPVVPDNRAITQHFDTIALETAKGIMCDVNRRHEFLGGEVQLLSRIQCRIDTACRAAMLQGSQPVSNRDELPVIGWLRSDYNNDDKRDPNAPLFMLGSNDPSEVWGVKYLPLSCNSPVIPDGYVVVPKRLTAENGAKCLLVGEFSETKFINCTECFGDAECETCDGSGRIEISVPVSWTNIKAIWAKGVEHFAAAPKQETL